MKGECISEKLKWAILQVERALGKHTSLPSLEGILIETVNNSLKLSATNLHIGVVMTIPAKITNPGKILVPGHILSTTIQTISDKNVFFEVLEGVLVITTKTAVVSIKLLPADDFPIIPMVSGKEFILDSTKMIEGVSAVIFSAAVSDVRPEIASIYIYNHEEFLVFVATDSFRLAEKKIKFKRLPEEMKILIPSKNVLDIIRILSSVNTALTIAVSKSQISFQGEGIYISSRLVDGTFYDYQQIIPKQKNTTAIFLKQDLIQNLKLLNPFLDKFHQVDLMVNPAKKKFTLKTHNQNLGEVTASIDAALEGESFSASFNARYLQETISSITTDSLQFSLENPQRALIVEGVGDRSYLYLVMPLNR